jgi:tRNA threonylcarbamoyladenosine biosynthesis protein TsaE
MTLFLPDEDATASFAHRLAAVARPGDVLLLSGALGAGKSSFARAFIRALAGDDRLEVPSPTFTLVQSYPTTRGEVWHYDLWRVEDHRALQELGWDEALSGITLVEWPERLGPLAPRGAVRVEFVVRRQGRDVVVTGEARWSDAV